jgi:hypothetical protein
LTSQKRRKLGKLQVLFINPYSLITFLSILIHYLAYSLFITYPNLFIDPYAVITVIILIPSYQSLIPDPVSPVSPQDQEPTRGNVTSSPYRGRRVELSPVGLSPDIRGGQWIAAMDNEPSIIGSDVDLIYTTSTWSTSPQELSYEARLNVVPDGHLSSDERPAPERRRPVAARQRPVYNPFVDTSEDGPSSEGQQPRVRVIDYDHLAPQFRPTLTLVLPENLPHLSRGQALLIPIRLAIQYINPGDVSDF